MPHKRLQEKASTFLNMDNYDNYRELGYYDGYQITDTEESEE